MYCNIDFAVSGVVVKWFGEEINERVIPCSSPVSRHSGSLFQKNIHFPSSLSSSKYPKLEIIVNSEQIKN